MKDKYFSNLVVFLPVFNGEKTVKRTISSLLNQTYDEFMIFICDDSSEDKSFEIIKNIKSNKIKIFQNSINRGLGYTLNKLMKISKNSAKYIALAEQDDFYYPYRFEKQISYFEKNSEAGLVAGIADHWDGFSITSRVPGILVKGNSYPRGLDFFKYNYREQIKVVNSCVMFRNEIHHENQMKFSEKYPSLSVDWDYILRFSLISEIHGLNISLVKLDRRINRNSLTSQNNLKYKVARNLIRDFRKEFPDIISLKDYKFAMATQKYIELSKYKYFDRIIECIKIFFIDPSKLRFLRKFLKVMYKPIKARYLASKIN